LNTIPVCKNAIVEPNGIAKAVIAVAIALSSSPNHRLQMIFNALRKIGELKDTIDDPAKIGQNLLSLNVLS
jgi:hypothetical protein